MRVSSTRIRARSGSRLLFCVVVPAAFGTWGCSSQPPLDSATVERSGTPTTAQTPTPELRLRVLFMGNSHTTVHDVPATVAAMVSAARPAVSVDVTTAPGHMFLSERLTDEPTLALMRQGHWDAVVFQAQKYSASGAYSYSTTEAQELVRRATARAALPVLFPEWPRRDIPEADRIFELHVSIARQTPACVAPVPQAFDESLKRSPSVSLHADDGNHSSQEGAFLAALVLFATITTDSPSTVPTLDNGIDPATQAQLRVAATAAVRTAPPRRLCPDAGRFRPGG